MCCLSSTVYLAPVPKIQAKANKGAYTNLRYALSKKEKEGGEQAAGLMERYAKLPAAEKQVWLSKFRVDPSCSWCSGMTQNSVEHMKEDGARRIWINRETLWEKKYAGVLAQELIDSGDIESKPHNNAFLARRGEVLYGWKLEWDDDLLKTGEKTSVRCEGTMEASQYAAVRSEMVASDPTTDVRSPRATAKPTRAPKQRSPSEEKKLADTRRITQSLAKASSMVQKVSKVVNLEALKEVDEKLGTKTWTRDMRTILQSEVGAAKLYNTPLGGNMGFLTTTRHRPTNYIFIISQSSNNIMCTYMYCRPY